MTREARRIVVAAADADHKATQVVIRFDPTRVTVERIKKEIDAAGFAVSVSAASLGW